ncbi:unnamed protein product [Pylaiella littoralis]
MPKTHQTEPALVRRRTSTRGSFDSYHRPNRQTSSHGQLDDHTDHAAARQQPTAGDRRPAKDRHRRVVKRHYQRHVDGKGRRTRLRGRP